MSLNIFGPYGPGVNPATSRPSDTGDPGPDDTWFQPCSSPSARDGTVVSYRWLNRMLGSLRTATRYFAVADDTGSDNLLKDAILRGGTLINIGSAGVSLYQGQNADKAHQIRKVLAGSNVTLTEIESPAGEFAVRIALTAPGSGPSGNTLGNVGDGADVYKGTNSTVEEMRGIKGIGPVVAATNGDNIEVGLSGGAYAFLLRNTDTTGQMAAQTIAGLTAETSPASTDELVLSKAGNLGLKKITVANLRAPATFLAGMIDVQTLFTQTYTPPVGWGSYAYMVHHYNADPVSCRNGTTSGPLVMDTLGFTILYQPFILMAFRLT